MSQQRNGRRQGFTLVELVVVVLVIGIIAAVAAPKMFNTATSARENSTRHSLAVVRDAIELYRSQNGSYPSAATALTTDLAPYLKGPFPTAQIGNTNATVGASSGDPITVSGGSEGWVYNATTGDFAINDASYISW